MTLVRKKLKIGLCIDVFDAVNGGVISTRRISRLLNERGHEVFIFSIHTEKDDPHFIPLKPIYLPFVKKVMQKLKTPLALPDKKRMRPVFKNLDIVHSMFPFQLGYTSIRLARENHIPVLCTFHVQMDHLFNNAGLHWKWLIRAAYRILIRTMYNRSDFILCPSPFAREELLRYGLKAPSRVLSNGVSDLFIPQAVTRPASLREKFIILSVGRLTPEKSHHTIMEAIALSKYASRIQLMLFGEGPLKEQLMHQAAKLPNPVLIELVTQEELAHYFNMADLYVHASEIETEGMAPLEAIACGVPLLVSDSPKSATSQFALDPDFLFRHENARDLADKLDYWIERPDQLTSFRAQYAEKANAYRMNHIVTEIENVYYTLVDENAKRLQGSDGKVSP